VESTGTYWVPVWNVLHERVAVIVANPEHVKARRGEKTDPEDSRRLAERLRVGDVRGSFVPSAQIVELRDLTRRRKQLLSAANNERNRIQKLLEQANVKIGTWSPTSLAFPDSAFCTPCCSTPSFRPPLWQI
jgi:transposase